MYGKVNSFKNYICMCPPGVNVWRERFRTNIGILYKNS